MKQNTCEVCGQTLISGREFCGRCQVGLHAKALLPRVIMVLCVLGTTLLGAYLALLR